MVRTPCCEKNGLKKGAWTPEEDKKLVDYITRYGHWNWRELPKFAGLSRCGKSCRLRWMNYLRPNIKIGNFNKEEEEIIINMHQELGNKWAAIAAKLPGRTDNEIKNYWHTNLKKRCKQNLKSPDSNPETSSEKVHECNSEHELEFSSLLPTVLSAQTLENSPPLSPVPSLSDSSPSRIAYGTAPSDEFVAISGDFWTEPYVAGNSYIQENIQQTWADPEFIFSLDLLLLEEYNYCTYGSSEDNYMEWFN